MNTKMVCVTEDTTGPGLINRPSWDCGPCYKNKVERTKCRNTGLFAHYCIVPCVSKLCNLMSKI